MGRERQIASLPTDSLEHLLPGGVVLQPWKAEMLLVECVTASVESDQAQRAESMIDLPLQILAEVRVIDSDEGRRTRLPRSQDHELSIVSEMSGQHPNETSYDPRFHHAQ